MGFVSKLVLGYYKYFFFLRRKFDTILTINDSPQKSTREKRRVHSEKRIILTNFKAKKTFCLHKIVPVRFIFQTLTTECPFVRVAEW